MYIWRPYQCKLISFRFSKRGPQDFCAGTAEFMSPEVLLSEDYGLSSDVFSLGMIMVEMQTGKEPTPDFPQRPPQVLGVKLYSSGGRRHILALRVAVCSQRLL